MTRTTVPALRPTAAVKHARERLRALAPPSTKVEPWFRFENKADEVAIFLHDEVGYWGTTSAEFVKELRNYHTKSLRVHINSPGGDVFDAIAIFNALASHPKPVTVEIDALAASAASFIALAGDTVIMQPNAMMMIHDAHTVAVGGPAEMIETADLLGRCSDIIAGIYAAKTGGTVESWRAVMAKDRWYTADEALAAGLVDEVPAQDTFDSSVAALTGKPFPARLHRDQAFARLAANLTRRTEWDSVVKHLKETS